MPRPLKILMSTLLLASSPLLAEVKVVATLSAYASIARDLVGDRGTVTFIARGDEDPHFVKPKPSFALMLRDADLFVTTGLDLELWGPTLVDKSGNTKIRDGQPGFVSVSQGVVLRDIPDSVSRAAGDVHIYGNPHIHTSPIEAKAIAADIAAGLARVDPAGSATYETNLADFDRRLDEALYGKDLLALLPSETLDPLAREGTLIDFLSGRSYEGRPMLDRLGGWLGKGLPFRGEKIVTYHKNWIYFTDLFGLQIIDYVEPKPGIPPSAKHVKELVDEIAAQHVQVLLAAGYFDPTKPQLIADRTGCRAVILPLGPDEQGSYFDLVDDWVDSIAAAFAAGGRS
ncbi:MAG: metal ABC transporter substrate-binding protein [Thermoanaerobaculia bacterium]